MDLDFTTMDFSDDAISTSYEPLPEGDYTVVLEKLTDKENKAGTGRYLEAVFAVVDDHVEHYNGRKVFHYFNYANSNAKAQAIGKGQLKSYAESVGIDIRTVKTPEVFIGLKSNVRLSVEPATAQYKASNRIQGFLKQTTNAVKSENDEVPF